MHVCNVLLLLDWEDRILAIISMTAQIFLLCAEGDGIVFIFFGLGNRGVCYHLVKAFPNISQVQKIVNYGK